MNAMARGGQWFLALAFLARMHHEMLERDGGGGSNRPVGGFSLYKWLPFGVMDIHHLLGG